MLSNMIYTVHILDSQWCNSSNSRLFWVFFRRKFQKVRFLTLRLNYKKSVKWKLTMSVLGQ